MEKLNQWVYATKCGDQLIILDLQKDLYVLLDEFETSALNNYILEKKEQKEFSLIIQNLIYTKIIDKNYLNNLQPLKKRINKLLITPEFCNEVHGYVTWLKNESTLSFFNICCAWMLLLLIPLLLKLKCFFLCFKYLIYLKKSKKQKENIKKVQKVIATVNKACNWIPFEVSCLSWSLVCVYFALFKKLSIDLLIGVSNDPFIAHAWIEVNGKPIIDSIQYDKYFNVIFSTNSA